MLVGLIIACEIGFWVVLAAGLVARYALRRPRLGVVLLACVPIVDVVLLGATAIDLRSGGEAGTAHGLAALYLGFSVAFGHQTIRAVDAWVAHRYAGGPAPQRSVGSGPARVREEWAQWRRAVLAWAVACSVLFGAILLVSDPAKAGALVEWIGWLTVVLTGWLIAGPVRQQLISRSRVPEPRP